MTKLDEGGEGMASVLPEMTEKMQVLYMDIIASLGSLPQEKKIYIFGDDDNEDMEWVAAVANYITMEFIKYSYDYSDPEYSMRHFLGDADDSERMRQSRTVQYVMKHKKKELERYPDLSPDHKFTNIDMDTIEQQLKGYRLTELNFFEHQNIHDLEVIKAIVEKRIGSAKKVPNPRFEDMFEQYDNMVEELIARSNNSDHDMVFASLALFTIEWKYAIETLYHIACLMEERNIKEIDQNTLGLLVGDVNIESQFGGSVATHSRMVKERRYILNAIFDEELDYHYKNELIDLIKEILVIGVYYKEIVETNDGELYKEWFRKQSTEEDWASFFRYYRLFDIWKKKEWTRKRIQNMRMLQNLVIRSNE